MGKKQKLKSLVFPLNISAIIGDQVLFIKKTDMIDCRLF